MIKMSNHDQITKKNTALKYGYKPKARIISQAVSGVSLEVMGNGPVEATKKALSRAGISQEQVGLIELN